MPLEKKYENNADIVAQQNIEIGNVFNIVSRDEELSLSERFQRKFQKQAIRTSSGVEIKIPTQVYSKADEIK